MTTPPTEPDQAPDVAVVVVTPLERKKRAATKVTRHSIPWVLLLPLIGWEFYAIKRGYEGGPLTHVVGWMYGPEYEWRWWLVSGVVDGLLLWAIFHFRWPHLVDGPWLLASISLMLVVGIVGAFLTSA